MRILGYLLIASPFIGIAIVTSIAYGIAETLAIFAGVAVMAGVIGLGVYLTENF